MRESRVVKVLNRVLPEGMGSSQKPLPSRPTSQEGGEDEHYTWSIPESQRDGDLGDMIEQIKDYQFTHGSMIKLVQTTEGPTVLSRPLGVSVYPTAFPRAHFDEAISLQKAFNKLYAAVAEDPEWLESALRPLIDTDPFTRHLWDIHKESSAYWAAETLSLEAQPISLGIFRSDYMLHQPNASPSDPYIPTTTSSSSSSSSPPNFTGTQLKQVEFNTISAAGGAHATTAASMHAHLALANDDAVQTADALPTNPTTPSLVAALARAHAAYGPSRTGHPLAVLLLVQPHDANACDERPLEYALWGASPPIECHRLAFGAPVLLRTSLGRGGALLYRMPGHGRRRRRGPREVSVVYFRAGFAPDEYERDGGAGVAARFFLERSRAIKCPGVLAHLASSKAVQRALAAPGAVERFLRDAADAAAVRRTFAPLYRLDGGTEEGCRARGLVRDDALAEGYVLKPGLEGGGRNVYGSDITGFLAGVDERLWANYVLMGRLRPPRVSGTLMGPRGLYQGPVVSEVGVFGAVMWERKEGGGEQGFEVLENENAGWSFKTKAAHVNEMSVVKGYGCFDCPKLVD